MATVFVVICCCYFWLCKKMKASEHQDVLFRSFWGGTTLCSFHVGLNTTQNANDIFIRLTSSEFFENITNQMLIFHLTHLSFQFSHCTSIFIISFVMERAAEYSGLKVREQTSSSSIVSRGIKYYYGIQCGDGCVLLTCLARHADLALARGRDVNTMYLPCDIGPYLLVKFTTPVLHVLCHEVIHAISRTTIHIQNAPRVNEFEGECLFVYVSFVHYIL